MHFVIVEDHPLYAEALELVITSALRDVRVSRAERIGTAKVVVQNDRDLDLVLLDLGLPDSIGYEGLMELRMMRPSMPVVVHSAYSDPHVIHSVIACGAAGFIPKSSSKEAVLEAIRDVLAGNVPLPQDYRPPPVKNATEADILRSKLGALTPQQMRVLQYLCRGRFNKDVAQELGIEETTVKAHVSEILRKLGVNSRTQAVLRVSKAVGSDEFKYGFSTGIADFDRAGCNVKFDCSRGP